jgi:hypothetical protein
MFWIGLIVGVVLVGVLGFVGAAYIIGSTFCSWDEFKSMCCTNADALLNRASALQVWHDGELISETYLDET